MPFGIDSGGQRVKVCEKGNCTPNLFIRDVFARCVRGKLACPGKHSGIPHASLYDPKELVVRFARWMQRKLRSIGIEVYIGFIFAGCIWSAMAARAIIIEKFQASH